MGGKLWPRSMACREKEAFRMAHLDANGVHVVKSELVARSEISFVAGAASSDDDIISERTGNTIDLPNGMDPWDQKKGNPSHGQGASLRNTTEVLVRLA